jgi:hypothetical protein
MGKKLAVVDGAVIRCAAGSTPSLLFISNSGMLVDDRMVAVIQDHKSGFNINPFGVCAFTNTPCVPVTPAPWFPGETTLIGNMFPLLDDASILGCAVGGIIAVDYAGEAFVYVGDERLIFKGDEQGPGFWESMIPWYGPIAAAGFASGQGRKGAMWGNLGLAAFDALTLGSGALLRAGATGAVKGAARGMRSLFMRRIAAARTARAMAMAGRVFGRGAAGSRWAQQLAGRSPREMYRAASLLAARFRAAAARRDGSFQRLRRALRDESGFAQIGPGRGPRSGRVPTGPAKGQRPKLKEHQQNRHVRDNPDFREGRSELTHPNPQELLDRGAGTGVVHGHNKEAVDFGEEIGNYVKAGKKMPTTRGTIHYDAQGRAHIVPANPNPGHGS